MPTVVVSQNSGADYSGVLSGQIKENDATVSYMGVEFIEASYFGSGDRTHSVFEFPVLPINSVTVSGAAFALYQIDSSAGTRTIDVHQLLRDINASTTWNKYDGTNDWATAGGLSDADRAPTALVSLSVDTTDGVYKSWASASLDAYVQDCINFGNPPRFWVRRNVGTHDGTFNKFYGTAGPDGTRPKLTIPYTAVDPDLFYRPRRTIFVPRITLG